VTTATQIDLETRVGPLVLRTPVVAASGTFGYGDEFSGHLPLERLGAVVTKTVTCEARAGNRPHRVCETPSGMLNSIGLENVGLDAFRARKLPRIRELPCPVLASIGGENPEELERLVAALEEEEGLAGYEVNFSCPNVRAGGARYWADARRLTDTVARLKARTRRSLWAKLSPNATDPGELALAAEAGGADALTVCNTFVGTAVDLERREFVLGASTGGLSGPAIRPLALAQVYEVTGRVRIPVVASGGVVTAAHVLEFVLVGATAVQVGTAHFVDPAAGVALARDLEAECARLGISRLEALRRAVRPAPPGSVAG
jgi:dihydroorotate dehydrogenase (NAD+) catalytic subunit